MPESPDPPEFEASKPRRAVDWNSLPRGGGSVNAVDSISGVSHVLPRVLQRMHSGGARQGQTAPQEEADEPSEAEHLSQLADVLDQSQQRLGSEEAALQWLRTPHPALDGSTPMSMLRSGTGLALVLQALAG